jgi:hypothetical protein
LLANDPLAPRPHIDPRKAAEVSDEDKDADDADAAAADADATSTQAGAQQGGALPAVRKTVKTVERPQTSAPARTNTYTAPLPTAPAQKSSPEAGRPRRVSDRPRD